MRRVRIAAAVLCLFVLATGTVSAADGNLVSHQMPGASETTYTHADGQVTTVHQGSTTEHWTWDGSDISEVTTGDDEDDVYQIVWAHPGQIGRVDRAGALRQRAAARSSARPRTRLGPRRRAAGPP